MTESTCTKRLITKPKLQVVIPKNTHPLIEISRDSVESEKIECPKCSIL